MKKAIAEIFDKKYKDRYPNDKENDYQYWHVRKMLEDSLHEGLVKDATDNINQNVSSLNTPLLALMHDTAHDLQNLRYHCEKMAQRLKETKEGDSHLYIHLEYLKSAEKGIRDKLDEYYINAKLEQKADSSNTVSVGKKLKETDDE